jgi:hypothetical protein
VKPTFADAGQNRHHCRPNVFTITIRVWWSVSEHVDMLVGLVSPCEVGGWIEGI